MMTPVEKALAAEANVMMLVVNAAVKEWEAKKNIATEKKAAADKADMAAKAAVAHEAASMRTTGSWTRLMTVVWAATEARAVSHAAMLEAEAAVADMNDAAMAVTMIVEKMYPEPINHKKRGRRQAKHFNIKTTSGKTYY
tara:strand:- start:28 stop:447 length:420 start_codon:yes stop_codon:yes gene_type:complete